MQRVPADEYEIAAWHSPLQKDIYIRCSDGTEVTTENVHEDSMTLDQSLVESETLTLSNCIASSFKIEIIEFDGIPKTMQGLWLSPTISAPRADSAPLPPYERGLGWFYCASDQKTTDRLYRTIECYDAMYFLVNTDCTELYNRFVENDIWFNDMRELVESILVKLTSLAPEAAVSVDIDSLDAITWAKFPGGLTFPSKMDSVSGADFLGAICDAVGCFCYINSVGNIALKQWSDPTDDAKKLVINHADTTEDPLPSLYEGFDYVLSSFVYDDQVVDGISSVEFQKTDGETNGIKMWADGDGQARTVYVVKDNLLLRGAASADMERTIIPAFLENVYNMVSYTPASITVPGCPWVELGDWMHVTTENGIIEFPILSRTLRGITALMDDFKASGQASAGNGGTESQSNSTIEQINGLNQNVASLKEQGISTSYFKRYSGVFSVALGKMFDVDVEGLDMEGGCTDGTYFYCALVSTQGTSAEGDDVASIIKIDPSTGEVVDRNDNLSIGHVATLTYNPSDGMIYTFRSNGLTGYKISPDDLSIVETFKRTGNFQLEAGISAVLKSGSRWFFKSSKANTVVMTDSHFYERWRFETLDRGETNQSAYHDGDFLYVLYSPGGKVANTDNPYAVAEAYVQNGIHAFTVILDGLTYVDSMFEYGGKYVVGGAKAFWSFDMSTSPFREQYHKGFEYAPRGARYILWDAARDKTGEERGIPMYWADTASQLSLSLEIYHFTRIEISYWYQSSQYTYVLDPLPLHTDTGGTILRHQKIAQTISESTGLRAAVAEIVFDTAYEKVTMPINRNSHIIYGNPVTAETSALSAQLSAVDRQYIGIVRIAGII